MQVQHIERAVSEQLSATTWSRQGYEGWQQLTQHLAQNAEPADRQVAAVALIALGKAKLWQDAWPPAALSILRQDPHAEVRTAAYEHFCF